MRITSTKLQVVATGFAIFSMFFGAGNLIFPPYLGFKSGINTWYGLFGLGISGIFLVIVGLIAMIMYEGDYKVFFGRLGEPMGFWISALILAMLGPFTVIPRAITVGFSILQQHIPTLILPSFSFLFLSLTFLIAHKKRNVVQSLGLVISPILIISLFIIIVKGYLNATPLISGSLSPSRAFWQVIHEGYSTMDLMAALHFAPFAINYIRAGNPGNNNSSVTYLCMQASLIAGALLCLTYAGLSYIGATYGPYCASNDLAQMFSSIVFVINGKNAAPLLNITVLMAILSTSVALAAIFADFLQEEAFEHKITYTQALLITLTISFLYSNVGLQTLMSWIHPILEISYPPLFVLVVCNILHKLTGFKPVKFPFYLTLTVSLAFYCL